MNYTEFRNKVQNWPIVFNRDLMRDKDNRQIIRNQLERWRRRKLLVKLKKGAFLLNLNDRKINPSRAYIANQLYCPSYVSLEYALSYYGLIPERVADMTSSTTKKTQLITNKIGTFVYRHIKPAAFRGFGQVKDEAGLIFFLAYPEKALVDFFYFNSDKFKKADKSVFEESYRFQNTERLNVKKIMEYAGLFKSGKLMRISCMFCAAIKKEGKKG